MLVLSSPPHSAACCILTAAGGEGSVRSHILHVVVYALSCVVCGEKRSDSNSKLDKGFK